MSKGPDFICFGLQKGGTRWLYDQMAAADGVWMPPIKELSYFTDSPFKPMNLLSLSKRDARLAEGGTESEADRHFFKMYKEGQANGASLDWYLNLFAPKGLLISGDVSPEYSRQDLSQIKATTEACPHSKYIFLLRDPVSRFWSALCQGIRKGRFVEENIGQWTYVLKVLESPTYQARSFPTRIWRRWSSILPPSALRFWFLEDIIGRPETVRQEIFQFICNSRLKSRLSPSFNRKRKNQKYEMSAEMGRSLAAYFDAEISEASELFAGHAIAWKKKNDALLRGARSW